MARHARSITLVAWFGALSTAAIAQTPSNVWVPVRSFQQTDGEALYRASCQGCHMPNGEGAAGAAAYPALAGNPKIAAAAFPITWVLKGFKAMPAFAGTMSDTQVAAVVQFIRTGLGNNFEGPVGPQDVALLR